jgi:cystathionine beta-lyase/cystathionine gamma-synthase
MTSDKTPITNKVMKQINTNKTPIYRDAGFYLENTEKTIQAFNEESENPHEPQNYIYSRYRNPTVVAVEKQLQKLNGSKWCLLSESGMASIDIALSIYQESSDDRPWLFFTEIYGGTNSYIDSVLIRRRDVHVERFAPKGDNYNMDEYIKALDNIKPKLVYFETVSNPMLIVADCKTIISEAKKRNIKVIVDNTFPTSFLINPLAYGADLVVESGTKYLSGHGDLTAGVLSGNDLDLMKSAIEYRKWVGHMISPDDAYRLGSQLLTFRLRYKQQMQNAQKLSDLLANHEKISKVFYPGLISHPTYKLANDLFKNKGFGAIITFQLAGETDEDKRSRSKIFIEKISDHFELIPSLGDCNTIFMPVDAVWGNKYPFPGTIRLSMGIEDFDLIEKVIMMALEIL